MIFLYRKRDLFLPDIINESKVGSILQSCRPTRILRVASLKSKLKLQAHYRSKTEKWKACFSFLWKHIRIGVNAKEVVPWEGAVLDGLLAILAPAVAIVEVVDLALGRERHTGATGLLLPLPLLLLFLLVVPASVG